jgi:hypothetical protein
MSHQTTCENSLPTHLGFIISNIPDLQYLPNGVLSFSCNILAHQFTYPLPLSYNPVFLPSTSFSYFLLLSQYFLLLNSPHLVLRVSRLLLLNVYPLCIPHRPDVFPSSSPVITAHSSSLFSLSTVCPVILQQPL